MNNADNPKQLPSDFDMTVWVVETTVLLGRILERMATLEEHANIATHNEREFKKAFKEFGERLVELETEMDVARDLKGQLETMAPDMRDLLMKVRALYDAAGKLRKSPGEPTVH
jgi:hypothetical protein